MPALLDTGQVGDLPFPGRNVVLIELAQTCVPTRSGHHFHQLDRGCEKPGYPNSSVTAATHYQVATDL